MAKKKKPSPPPPNKPRRGANPSLDSRGVREWAQKLRDLAAQIEGVADSMVAQDIPTINPTVQRLSRILDEIDEKIATQFTAKVEREAKRQGLIRAHKEDDI